MKRIAIIAEGGGKGTGTQSILKNGMNQFFRAISEQARDNGFQLKLAVCGSRNKTFRDFHIALKDTNNSHVFLLVDSDGPINKGRLDYLAETAGFKNLSGAEEHFIHLMIQTMEVWIMADGNALAVYYGQQFARNALPKAGNLETIAKSDLDACFKRAIAQTRKPEYDKIHDAAALLSRINPAIVQSRCPSARRFFEEVTKAITA